MYIGDENVVPGSNLYYCTPSYNRCNYQNQLIVPIGKTAQKMKFSSKDFVRKCDEIRSFLWIWSHLMKKYLMENFIFCLVFCEARCLMIAKHCNNFLLFSN